MASDKSTSRPSFHLKTREDVEAFDKMLQQYVVAGHEAKECAVHPAPLITVYDFLRKQNREDWYEVFVAYWDMRISFVLLELERRECVKTLKIGAIKGDARSVLESFANFSVKMNHHSHLGTYVLRYRAIWDKVMGFLVMLFAPHDYKGFDSTKSKKGKFKKIMQKVPQVQGVSELNTLLETFDNSYRTAEAHGTGRLRKFTFLLELDPMDTVGSINLVISYGNALNRMMHRISALFGYKSSIDMPSF